MVNGNSHKMNTSDFCMYGGCWSTYIHKRPNIGNALRGLFTGTQSEKDGSNKARVSSHMSLGVISTKQLQRLFPQTANMTFAPFGKHNPSHVQQHALLSPLSHNFISSLYFIPFPRGLQHKRKVFISCCHKKPSCKS